MEFITTTPLETEAVGTALAYRQRPGDVIFNTVSMSVVNRSGYEMPKSGGIGTNAVTTMGALLIAASGAMLLLLKRRRKGTKA